MFIMLGLLLGVTGSCSNSINAWNFSSAKTNNFRSQPSVLSSQVADCSIRLSYRKAAADPISHRRRLYGPWKSLKSVTTSIVVCGRHVLLLDNINSLLSKPKRKFSVLFRILIYLWLSFPPRSIPSKLFILLNFGIGTV